jgi:CheY-like chemotaxis protein
MLFVREVLDMHRGGLEISRSGDELVVVLSLPVVVDAKPARVLVVDDNADLVAFYRAYVAGTRYQIEHVVEGGAALQAAQTLQPDIVVLDVMLPDIDGWELLVQLHGHPATSAIPVIVCSVIRDPELAIALGAAAHLAKPVRRRQFLDALDAVITPARA